MNGHDHCLEQIGDDKRYDRTNFYINSKVKLVNIFLIETFIYSPIQFLTSGAGSKAWRGDVRNLSHENLKFFYDGQGFMSVQLTNSDAEITFYDVYGKVLHRWSMSKQLLSDM